MGLRVSRYSTNATGYTFVEWCEAAGVKLDPYWNAKWVGKPERKAWKEDNDPCDWLQANLQVEEARRLGREADPSAFPEPPWKGNDLFTLRKRRAWLEGFHQALYSQTKKNGYDEAMASGDGFIGPGVRPCLNGCCNDDRCRRLRDKINEQIATEVMER